MATAGDTGVFLLGMGVRSASSQYARNSTHVESALQKVMRGVLSVSRMPQAGALGTKERASEREAVYQTNGQLRVYSKQ